MLWELQVGEQRYRAVREVLDGASVTEVARRFGVNRPGFCGGSNPTERSDRGSTEEVPAGVAGAGHAPR